MILFGFKRREEPAFTTQSLRTVRSVWMSEVGSVRGENQDKVFVDESHRVYCVADGMGGGEEGSLASELVVRNLKMMLAASGNGFKDRVAAVEKALIEANAAIYAYAREHGYEVMGSTAAVLVLDPDNLRHMAVCNVGDTRVYRIRRGMPDLLSHDHRQDPNDNLLTRAVGAREKVRTDWMELTTDHESRLVICTDGVHDVVSAGRLAVFASCGSIEQAAERIKEDVLKHGAPDNFSFIIVSV